MRPYGKSTYVYLIALLLHLAAIVAVGLQPDLPYSQELLFFSKLALMPVLLWTVWREADRVATWWIAAIAFSWLGDFWLADMPLHFSQATMFLLGLASFFVAHLCYLRRMRELRHADSHQASSNNKWLRIIGIGFLAFVVFIGLFIDLSVILFSLSSLAIVAYAIVLLIVLVRTIRLASERGFYRPAAYGAGLFVLSDALIGAGLFVTNLKDSAILSFFIMLLYGLAQLGLASLAVDNRTSVAA